jgi:hypothetical protein
MEQGKARHDVDVVQAAGTSLIIAEAVAKICFLRLKTEIAQQLSCCNCLFVINIKFQKKYTFR